nr:sugar transferase [Desertimonas flava]
MSGQAGAAASARGRKRYADHDADCRPPWVDGRARHRLLNILRTGDAVAVLIGFVVPLFGSVNVKPDGILAGTVEVIVLVIAGVWAVRFQELWTSRVMAVRSMEISRITRALAILSLVALVLDRKSSMDIRAADVAIAAATAWVVLVAWRAAYRAYIAAEHRQDRLLQRVVVVGTGSRAEELKELFEQQPELGMRISAVIGPRHEAISAGLGGLWVGDLKDAARIVARTEAELVILCSADLDPGLVHHLTSTNESNGHTVYVDPGMSRVDFRRMRATALGHQPVFEVESASLSYLELATKRTFDLVVAGLVAIVALPVMVLVALAIKLDDGGPVFFRQQRVGRHGELFSMIKFRSMCMDAELKLAELKAANERSGVLFKMERDPRVTRVGRFIRATSLDELPQLFNVVGGTMSIVGPRPALQSEVDQFPEELHARHSVRPGITGLWQAEARDNPSFGTYRRLDLFYVENWSLLLDMTILLATADHFVLRPLFKLRYRGSSTPRTDQMPTAASVDELMPVDIAIG